MKILAVMGSPREGDSYGLTRRVEDHLSQLGDYEVEYLWLKDLDIGFCRGCYACLTYGEERCPADGDIAAIEEQLLSADGVIFASPVYAMSVTALMKNLMDRMAYSMHRPRFFDQQTVLVATAGAAGIDETLSTLKAWEYCGFDIVDSFGFIVEPRDASEEEERKRQARTKRAAQTLHKAISRDRPSAPSLMRAIYFRIQQQRFQNLKEEAPKDYEYFSERGWFDPSRRYYTDAPVGFSKNIIARAVAWLATR